MIPQQSLTEKHCLGSTLGFHIYIYIYIYICIYIYIWDGWMDSWMDLGNEIAKFDCGFYSGVAFDIWVFGWMKHSFRRRANRTLNPDERTPF